MAKQILQQGRRWYVLHTYSGYEENVARNLRQRIESMDMEDKIYNVLIPTENRIRIKNGKRKIVTEKIFPGYVLVEMLVTDDSWYVVRNTPNVTGFVGSGTTPTPIDPALTAKNAIASLARNDSRIAMGPRSMAVVLARGQHPRSIDGAGGRGSRPARPAAASYALAGRGRGRGGSLGTDHDRRRRRARDGHDHERPATARSARGPGERTLELATHVAQHEPGPGAGPQ